MRTTSTIYVKVFLIMTGAGLAPAAQSGFEVLDGEHHVWGHAYYWSGIEEEESVSVDYDVQSPWPVSPLCGSAWIDSHTWAESCVDWLSVAVRAYSSRPMWETSWAAAYAEGWWIFRPECERVVLTVDTTFQYQEDWVTVELLDRTAGGEPLYYYSGIAWGVAGVMPLETPFVSHFTLDPTHEYYMHIYTYTGAGEDGLFHGQINLRVIPAPPALLLVATGATFTGWLRRHRTL